jgi:hypothetical protein
MTCKGKCSPYQAFKQAGMGRYGTGQKRCQVCEIFINWEGLWCPCCGCRLRGKPRNIKFKTALRRTNGQSELKNDGITNRKEIVSNGDGTFTVQEIQS